MLGYSALLFAALHLRAATDYSTSRNLDYAMQTFRCCIPTTVRTNQRWHTTWPAVEDDADIESESVESNQVVVAIVTGHI